MNTSMPRSDRPRAGEPDPLHLGAVEDADELGASRGRKPAAREAGGEPPSVRSLQNQWSAVALVGIITIASTLRLGGIGDVGIRFDDEGAFVGDARLWHRCAKVLLDGEAVGAVVHRDKKAFQARLDAYGVDFGARYVKPSQGYTFLGAATMFVVGDRPAALLALNAVCGMLTVVVLYAIGALLFNRPTALCAALFLAVSPYHVFYSRSAMTEATAGFFVALGLLAWVYGIKRGWSAFRTYGLSGLVLGYAVTCHLRSLYVVGVLVLTELFMFTWRGAIARGIGLTLRRASWRWLGLALGLAIPAMTIQGLFLTARAAAGASDSYLPLVTYFEALMGWLRFGAEYYQIDAARTAGTFGVSGVTYLAYLMERHGPVAFGLTAVGLIAGLLKPGLARVPALLVFVTFALLWNQPSVIARTLSTALPGICLCAAIGLAAVGTRLRRRACLRGVVLTALALLVVAPGAQASLRLCRERSSIADACRFLASQGPAVAAVPIDTYHRSKYWLYLEGSGVTVRNENFHREGTPAEVVRRLRSEGVRWLIMDPQRWHFREFPEGPRNRLFEWWERMDEYLVGQAYIAAEFPHISGFCREFLAEGPGPAFVDEMIAAQAGRLRIYDLRTDGAVTAMREFDPDRAAVAPMPESEASFPPPTVR